MIYIPVCAVCARALNPDGLSSFADLFSDVTVSSGRPLLDVFRALVGRDVDVDPRTSSSRVCQRCEAALNDIEGLYLGYRRAADALLGNLIFINFLFIC